MGLYIYFLLQISKFMLTIKESVKRTFFMDYVSVYDYKKMLPSIYQVKT